LGNTIMMIKTMGEVARLLRRRGESRKEEVLKK
jgi:hypothetical protein